MSKKLIVAESEFVLRHLLQLLKDAKAAGKTLDDVIDAFEKRL